MTFVWSCYTQNTHIYIQWFLDSKYLDRPLADNHSCLLYVNAFCNFWAPTWTSFDLDVNFGTLLMKWDTTYIIIYICIWTVHAHSLLMCWFLFWIIYTYRHIFVLHVVFMCNYIHTYKERGPLTSFRTDLDVCCASVLRKWNEYIFYILECVNS